MASLKADPAQIEALAAQLSSGSAQIAAELSQLQSASNTLQHLWSGDAQQAYAFAQQRWTSQVAELVAIADAASSLAATWSTGLSDLERDLARGWPS